MTKNGITLRDLYDEIGKLRVEFTKSIDTLAKDFHDLEEGRISTLETTIANLQGRIFATVAIITFIISVGIAILGIVLR